MSTKCIKNDKLKEFYNLVEKKQLIQDERHNSVQLIFKLYFHTYVKRETFGDYKDFPSLTVI